MDERNRLPFVSVVVPFYRDRENLKLCLEALAQQTYPPERFAVIVVNNDPDDDALPPLSTMPVNLHVIEEARPGSYAARNAGVRAAAGEVLAFTDSDCIPCPQWLAAAVDELQDGADLVAGEIQLFFVSEPGHRTVAELYEFVFGFDQGGKVARHGACATANLVTRRTAFLAVGEFNQTMLSGGDLEWGWRARKAGYTIRFVPEAIVLHPARATLKQLFTKRRRVLGGSLMLAGTGPSFFLTGFLPPFNQYRAVARHPGLTTREKLRLVFFLYVVKLHKTIYTIKLRVGLATPQRR